MEVDLQHARTVPLIRTPAEGFWSSSYKHATPNRVKTRSLPVNTECFHSFLSITGLMFLGGWGLVRPIWKFEFPITTRYNPPEKASSI
jgi:hypothetical protein